ncbi:Asp23/Gls24 family envelope stress response protein [Amycolatopsis orientalis]|uniref:Asp23/Gls24 family envelope stress response protein n=1 Tax=Amycolatopsis orientalis TaxID=31958 RepID=UPI000410C8D7|nr:Asp23/Gls24 family envelope stress response protein [Amycolatopsis orientalis]
MTLPPEPGGPENRGTLTIAPAVVRKIAQHAADQVDGTTRAERRIAGLGLGTHGASAKVGGEGNDVDLVLDVALNYPAPVRRIVGDLRARVTEEVERITSYRVRDISVTVSALLPDIAPRVR